MLSTGQGTHPQHNGQDLYHQNDENQMKRWWQESLSESIGLPEGYTKVSVLIIKWEEQLDQLQVDAEVQALREVFEVDFAYETRVLALGPKNPQMQLLNGVTGFIVEKDGRNNLMIIYYAGHGVFHKNRGLLELSPSNEEQTLGLIANKVFWNEAEKFLVRDAASDVLSIMDCCYSSNLVRSSGTTNRAFEMLSASGMDRVTEEPGETSFTTALVKSLRKLVLYSSGCSFSTRDLVEDIQKQRVTNPPALWRRITGIATYNYIRLEARSRSTNHLFPETIAGF
ncbi:hypothetical protein MPH_00276 [Macrophomina phaseolina MS6]|uniref:Peptidase C14 caspase catalytic n=1 Tax=Macrophomina phaseolina (strain MS6) TaxID=1126212 RepID=K2SIT4_MACPH|nr:hypothetical protein MPH_00276 [Macrophomina phaseolina MS6]